MAPIDVCSVSPSCCSLHLAKPSSSLQTSHTRTSPETALKSWQRLITWVFNDAVTLGQLVRYHPPLWRGFHRSSVQA